MTSDNERREVARKLRETGEELGSSVLLWYHIAKILGVRTATDGKTACDRLADLIYPTCLARADVEDTPDGGQFECWSCSVCGNIVSVDPDYDTETDGPAYCEACGHRIVGKGEPTWL